MNRLDQNCFTAFWYWINERHQIYLNRQAGMEWPWTKDPILQEYSFCNVFRELDTVTIWIREHLRTPFADHANLWFTMCVARQINWPPTLRHLLDATGLPEVWDPDHVYEELMLLKRLGEKVYTGAYMLRGDIQSTDGGDNNKPKYTVYKVLDPVWKGLSTLGQECFPTTIQEWTETLEKFHGWGGFLAYEVATDLRHTRYLRDAPDIMTWANPGPGAKRGLNRIFGRPVGKNLSRVQALEEMRWLLEVSHGMLGPHVPALEMRDIEHSLCETDKYLRVKNGEGRPRAKYHHA